MVQLRNLVNMTINFQLGGDAVNVSRRCCYYYCHYHHHNSIMTTIAHIPYFTAIQLVLKRVRFSLTKHFLFVVLLKTF